MSATHFFHAECDGTNAMERMTVRWARISPRASSPEIPDRRIFLNSRGSHLIDETAACDKASPACSVMLHLRACYVSKAAILTISAHHGPVENRSPV